MTAPDPLFLLQYLQTKDSRLYDFLKFILRKISTLTEITEILSSYFNGYLYIPARYGPPTEIPPPMKGRVPMIYDTQFGVLYVFLDGTWRIH